ELEQVRSERDGAFRRVDELARALQALDREKQDFKQRLTREREQLIDVEKGNVALALLEAIDELDRSLAAAVDVGEDSALAQGVRLIRDNLLRKAMAIGIARLDVEGRPFDPNTAEASDIEVTFDPERD